MGATCSETNVANSVATFVTGKLLADGYLIYWHQIDALQTPTAWYPDYSVQQSVYRQDVAFNTLVQTASGILTVVGNTSAVPRVIARLPNDGTVPGPDTVAIPALSIAVGAPNAHTNYELGSTRKWRARRLSIDSLARDEAERGHLADRLAAWLDGETVITVLDHDSGTLAPVGELYLSMPSVRTTTALDSAEAATFAATLNARLEYVE